MTHTQSPKSLKVLLFGAPQVFLDARPLENFISNKARALLFYLAATRRPHTRDALAGMFWGEMPNREARINLRQVLSNLRKIAPEVFLIDRQNVALNPEYPHEIDAVIFAARMDAWQDNPPPERRQELLEEAVSLYRGEFLAGFYLSDAPAFDEWTMMLRARFAERALQAYAALAEILLRRRRYPQAVAHLQRVLAMDPWREDAHRRLMMAFARMGESQAALAQYRACKEVLAAELDVLPSPETRLLYERIKARGERSPGNLPRQPTAFVGRAAETAAVRHALTSETCRWLTITGLGGVGKTRLALEVADRMRPAFFDGVFFVPLASVHAVQGVVNAIGEALGLVFEEQGSRAEQLGNYLRSRETLLVLDNCEHLAEMVPYLETLLERTEALKLLVTSRQKLGGRWEHLFPLRGFVLPHLSPEAAEDAAAVRLFLQNARRVRPDFAPSEADIHTIAAICRALDGLPLGIELAALWTPTMTCGQILQAIREDPVFLDASLTPQAARSHGLRAALRYVWRQLSPEEQGGFARLAVFADAFTPESLREVAGISPLQVAKFVERGLLRPAVEERPTGAGYYEMHQLWRQFAEERLAEMPAEGEDARLKHRRYYLRLLLRREENREHLPVPDYNNVLSAWEHVLAHGAREDFENSTQALSRLLEKQHRFEELQTLLLRAIRRARDDPQANRVFRARWLRLVGEASFRLGQLHQSEQYHREALALLGGAMPLSPVRQSLGLGRELLRQVVHRWRMPSPVGRAEQELALLESARAYERLGQILFFANAPTAALLYTSVRGMNLAEKARPSDVLSRLYGNMIIAGALVSHHKIARFYRRLALQVAQSLDSPSALSWVLELSSIHACGIGDWERTARDVEQAIALADRERDTRRRHECMVMVTYISHARGDFRRSAEMWLQVHVDALQSGDVQAQRWGLSGQGRNFIPLGRLDEAVTYLQSALDLPVKVRDIVTDINAYGALARALCMQGRLAEAGDIAEAGLRLVSETSPTSFSTVRGYDSLAWTYLRLWETAPWDGALAAAARRAEAALWQFARVFPIGRPAALLSRGTRLWLEGRRSKALRLWQKGIACARELQMPYQEASLSAEIARFLPEKHPERARAAARSREICARLQVPVL